MKQTKLDDLKVKLIKLTELLLAIFLALLPLLLYLYNWLTGDFWWSHYPGWQRWLMVLPFTALPSFCGIVWLVIIYRRRKSIAEYPDDDIEEEKTDA